MTGKKKKRITILLSVLLLLIVWWFNFPSTLFQKPYSFVLKDKGGQLMGAVIATDGQWRFPPAGNVPDKFVKCITTYEDKRFFYHPGVDPLALGRSIVANIRAGKVVQGGSTLTMQVMRMSRDRKKRSWFQKIIECLQAVRLECTYSKKEILSLYASNAPFGSNVVGLEAASWRYFGRKPESLSWGEMASLTVLPNSPSLIFPGKNNKAFLRKRNDLINALFKRGIIDSITCMLSKEEALPGKPFPLPQVAPHLLQRFRSENLCTQQALCESTLDIHLQKEVNEIVALHHDYLKGNGIRNLAALVIDVSTGQVLAYSGNIQSENPDDESNVDIIKSARSPGSTLKPILYAAAFSDGQLLPNMLLPDVPTQIGGYTPQNFDKSFDGAVPASEALSRSLNIPAVKVLQQYKYARFYDLLKKLGISTMNQPADHYGLSMILGGCEVSLWELTGIYAGMARALLHANKNNGKVFVRDFYPPVYQKSTDKKISDNSTVQELDATSIWFAFKAMQEVMRPGDDGLWQQFTSSQKIAWKTGTSFGFRDAWAIGISSKYAVGVWAGNANGEGRPDLLGIKAAAPAMFDIFRSLPDATPFPRPQSGFAFIPVCRKSGFRAGLDCQTADTILMPPASVRSPICPFHQLIHLDPAEQYRVSDACMPVSQMKNVSWFVLPPSMEWYYRQKHYDYKPLPPWKSGCGQETESMEIIYPERNAKIYIPLELDGLRGKLICIAAHRNPSEKIFWHLDGEFIGSTTLFHKLAISAGPGMHTLTLVDASGKRISRQFEILQAAR